jgi:L-alanine-DL-glutamate epimerase-like enolase superfamily enzyme
MCGMEIALWDIIGKKAGLPALQARGRDVPRPRADGGLPAVERTKSRSAQASYDIPHQIPDLKAFGGGRHVAG